VDYLKTDSTSLLSLKEKDNFVVVNFNDVLMIKTENKVVHVFTSNKRYTSNKRLYELEEILGKDFFRISKSTIINLMEIEKVFYSFNGQMNVMMKNGSIDIISRKYLKKFKEYIGL
jgi:DNA-binding LytR/AlgR family response regulator